MKRVFNLVASAIALSPLALTATMTSGALASDGVVNVPEEKAFCRLTSPTSFEVVDKGGHSIVIFELKNGMYPFVDGVLDRNRIVAKGEAGRGMSADLQGKKCYVQPNIKETYIYSLR